MKNKIRNKEGFTLLEILLVIAALAILAGIVIVAINPTKQLGETRDAKRRSNVNTILNAVYQEALDNDGVVNTNIPTSVDCPGVATNEICKIGGACAGLVDVSSLTTLEKYLTTLPVDPSGGSTNGTGYHVAKSANGRITVCAPDAEEATSISVKR